MRWQLGPFDGITWPQGKEEEKWNWRIAWYSIHPIPIFPAYVEKEQCLEMGLGLILRPDKCPRFSLIWPIERGNNG